MTVSCQSSAAAASAQVPIRAPLAAGWPRFPVRGGFGPDSTALAGSRVVQVLPSITSAARFKASRPDQPTPEEISVLRLAWEDLAA